MHYFVLLCRLLSFFIWVSEVEGCAFINPVRKKLKDEPPLFHTSKPGNCICL